MLYKEQEIQDKNKAFLVIPLCDLSKFVGAIIPETVP